MAPTTDDLRSLLDERSGPGHRGPWSDRTATARLAGVRGRVRRTRTRQAVVAAAAAVAIVAGAVNVLAPPASREGPPAAPTSSDLHLPPSPPAQDFQGRPRALTATLSTNGPRAVTYTVIPRRAELSFASDCSGSPTVEHWVYINGQFSHGGPCSAYGGAWLTRGEADWDEWSVAAGRPMTVEILLVLDSERDAPGRLQDAPRTTFIDSVYGDVEVVSPPALLAKATPDPLQPEDLPADVPVVARGVVTQDRRSVSFTTAEDLDGFTLRVRCAGVTSGIQLGLVLDGRLLHRARCGSSKGRFSISVDRSARIPRGSRLMVILYLSGTSGAEPVSGAMDAVAMAFELRGRSQGE